MPRFARRPRVVSRKRQTKWCGAVLAASVPAQTDLVVGDATKLCGDFPDQVDYPDPLVGWVKGQISLSRILTGEINAAVAWAVVLMRTDVGTTNASQVFEPFSSDHLERQDILGMGFCAVPPVVLNAADASVINRGATVTPINIKVGRRLHRNTNNLFLWMASIGATDNSFQSVGTFRTLMKFG